MMNLNKHDEFNFADNKHWLIPFLIALNRNFDKTHIITYNDVEIFAIKNVDKVFRPKGIFTKSYNKYYYDWMVCSRLPNIKLYDNCRKSPGFENKHVPSSRKFNPKYKNIKLKYELQLAKESYNYLEYIKEIDLILRTPSSDYTRFSNEDQTAAKNKNFIIKLRDIQLKKSVKDPYEAVLKAYDYYDKFIHTDEFRETIKTDRRHSTSI